jgi:F420H(2)-dependent quinone reductase
MSDRDEILRSLSSERTVDIVTTGRQSGQPRTTEIWITPIGSRVFICGTPNASRDGVVRAPRDWLANLTSHAALVVRLKTSISAELTADAAPVTNPDERRRILMHASTQYYRDAVSLDAAVAHSPIVELTFTGEAAWVNDALRESTD